MKFTAERDALNSAIDKVKGAVERRTTIPILANIALTMGDNGLKIRATDLDMTIDVTVQAELQAAGDLTMPGHFLSDILRKLPKGAQVLFDATAERGKVSIRAARAKFSMQTLPMADFPDITVGELTHNFELKAADLRLLLSKSAFAMSNEETRYYLNGVFMHTVEVDGQPKLRAVATDGHRLARIEMDAPKGSTGMPGIIVPKKAVAELLKIIGDGDAIIGVGVSSGKIVVTAGDVVLTSKLIDGTFPDYGRVIPAGNDKIAIVDKDAFARAVDRVSTISAERGRAVKFSFADGKLVMTVNNPDTGTSEDEFDCDYDGPPLEIGFNARYATDLAAHVAADTIRMAFNDAGSPAIWRSRDGSSELYVLMPMRV